MTRNVEMEITFRELIVAVKHRWKIIGIITVLCAVLGCAAGYVRSTSTSIGQDNSSSEQSFSQDEQKAVYEEKLELYNEVGEVSEEAATKLKEEWVRLSKLQKEHPFMELDPYDCKYVSIVLRFEPQSGNHYGVVHDWVMNADDDKIFGSSKNDLLPYKTSLISIQDRDSETSLQIIKVKGFDVQQAANYLKSVIRSHAVEDNIEIEYMSSSSGSGYIYSVADLQKYSRDSLNTVNAALTNVNNVSNVFAEPEAPQMVNDGISKRALLKYILAGLIFGLIVGIALVMILILFQRRVISRRQIEDTFDLELLSDFSRGSEAALDILNANLDVMTADQSRVLVLGTQNELVSDDVISEWNDNSDRVFIAGKNIIDDSRTIDALKTAEGIVLGVQLSESKLDDIQRVILRANKLGKKVLGYVQI